MIQLNCNQSNFENNHLSSNMRNNVDMLYTYTYKDLNSLLNC